MRYLVTGGCGFIGSHLVDALIERGDEVRVVDDLSTGLLQNLNKGASLLSGSVLDQALMRRAVRGVQVCIHLAAIASVTRSAEDWVGSHGVNQTGLIVVLDALRRAKVSVPLVYASSAAVYGDQLRMPIAETASPMPLSAYGADKLCCEAQARTAARSYGLPSLGLRFFNVYGPRQDSASPYSGVISIFARSLLARSPLTIFGDGLQTRDFVFVGDVVACLLAAVGKASMQADVLNVCTGRGTTVSQLAAAVMNAAGASVPVMYSEARVGDIRLSVGSPVRAVAELGRENRTPLHVGLRRTLEWLCEVDHNHSLRPDI